MMPSFKERTTSTRPPMTPGSEAVRRASSTRVWPRLSDDSVGALRRKLFTRRISVLTIKSFHRPALKAILLRLDCRFHERERVAIESARLGNLHLIGHLQRNGLAGAVDLRDAR